MSMTYLEGTGIPAGEYYALVLLRDAGMIVMAAATDLIVIFLGLEVMSISVYVLAGAWRTQPRSNEAALKYFLLGAFATGFLLYGIALLYGATGDHSGSTQIAAATRRRPRPHRCCSPASRMLLVGFGFKVAAVPFHMWTPDVYEGAPTTVTALMAVGVKAAAFAALRARLPARRSPACTPTGRCCSGCSRSLTMTVGNVLALRADATSSACSPTRASRTPATCWSALVAGGAAGGAARALLPRWSTRS